MQSNDKVTSTGIVYRSIPQASNPSLYLVFLSLIHQSIPGHPGCAGGVPLIDYLIRDLIIPLITYLITGSEKVSICKAFGDYRS